MFELKKISPLLDGFSVGNPISEHDGVVCCPAIKENTDKKFILKVITVPATQAQLDALLIAGAYKDPADAMEYYRRMGEDILKEAELLKNLSRLEGFLPYDDWQMEPITRRRLGYEVYLVGSYKRSLEKYIRKNAVTQLEAVNLGLDLCSALSVCRQAGYIYVALKPSNIYVSDKKEYRIGDLGFLSLDSLRYASLPDRYHGPYTPPELFDPMTPLSLTVDTYAVGMILYQLYNDGHLPFTGKKSDGELPTPVNADYEMAEIIMKAIHPDPALRWDDPKELGKALASYMQRNSVNDIPITPFIPLDVNPDDIVVISPKKEQAAPEEQPDNSETEPTAEAVPESEIPEETISVETEDATETSVAPEVHEEVSSEPEILMEETGEAEESEIVPEEPAEEAELELSEELSKIMHRANDLIAHEIPEDTAFPEAPEDSDPFAFAEEESEAEDDTDIPEEPLMDENSEEKTVGKKVKKRFINPAGRQRIRKFFSTLLLLVLLCAAGVGGFWYYQNVYLQTIDGLSVSGSQNEITVLIDTSVDESTLVVKCSDNYGKVHTGTVTGGKVTFSNLHASTLYTIEVEMEGFHKLKGKTTEVYTTDATTQILSFTAIAGSEDGSVILNFTVDGDEPDFWNIRYSAEGEETLRETITNHSTMITGLTVGKVYTFTIDGGSNFDLGGETSLDFMASRLILAEDIVVNSSNGSDIMVSWNTPGDVVVENWEVYIHDGYGFEEKITVTENQASFQGIDASVSYDIEITASGMTQPAKTIISADPVNISEFHVNEKNHAKMEITWEYTGSEPEGGWLLIYTVDGSGKQIVKCDKPEAEISPLIPGANYQFTLQAADNRSIFNNTSGYTAKDAEVYAENNVVLENMEMDLLKTPEDADWRCENISDDAFTNSFAPGDAVSIAMRSSSSFYTPGYKTNVLYVFRNSYGNVLPDLVCEETYNWSKIWSAGEPKNGELNIPKLPAAPGDYVLELYFNGFAVAEFDMTIS